MLFRSRELAQQLKSLVESGSKDALVPLATLQLFGLNAMQIEQEAVSSFVLSQLLLLSMLAQAFANAERARAAGDQSAVHLLAQMYRAGKADEAKARDVLRAAPSDDCYHVYQRLRVSEPVAKELAEAAVKELRVKAETGDPVAEFCLGASLDNGCGVERDHKAAAEWYRKAVAQV